MEKGYIVKPTYSERPDLYECAMCSALVGSPYLCETCTNARLAAGDAWLGPRPPNNTPRHCPWCGSLFVECESVAVVEGININNGEISYDCYCATCEWSGDIRPDTKLEKGK